MPDEFSSQIGASSSGSSGAIVAIPPRPPQLPVPTWSYGPPAVPEIVNAKPGPVELIHALRRRWMVATGVGLLLGSLLSAIVWFFVPIRYEVVALLRVFAIRPVVLREGGVKAEADYSIYKRTQSALFKSNFVLQATLRKPEIKRLALIQKHKDDVIDWLSNQLSVEYPGDSEIMRVSMKGDQPKELATIVNAVKDSYMEEIVNGERMERLRQRDLLTRLYSKNRKEIEEKITALNKLHKEFNTASDVTARLKLNMAVKQLDRLVEQRNGIQSSVAELDMRMLLLKTRDEMGDEIEIPDFIIDQQLATDPQMSAINQALAQGLGALEEARRRTKNQNSSGLTRLREQTEGLQKELDARRDELRPILVEMFKYSNQGENRASFLPLMETEKATLLSHLEKLDKDIVEKMNEMLKLDGSSALIDNMSADLKTLKEVTDKMAAELKMWSYEVDASPRIQSIEDATVPSGNDAMRKYVAVAFAGITGFACVLFGVAILEFQSRRLNSEREVREGLGIRVIGHLPALSGRAWRKLGDSTAAGAHLQSLLTESVDSIRATLIHSNGANPPRVVMVSSSDTQEGKTTVASQLAASLARAGRRTLLLDGDLRNPTSHVVFGLPLEPGFAEVLRGDAEREAAVYATPSPNLWLMPAGQYDAAALQSLCGETLVNLFKSLKEQYDFVIVDAPPVLKVADPLIFGQCVDAAVLSVRRDVSRIPKIYEACENLRAVGVKVLGAIVNGVSDKPMKRSAPLQM